MELRTFLIEQLRAAAEDAAALAQVREELALAEAAHDPAAADRARQEVAQREQVIVQRDAEISGLAATLRDGDPDGRAPLKILLGEHQRGRELQLRLGDARVALVRAEASGDPAGADEARRQIEDVLGTLEVLRAALPPLERALLAAGVPTISGQHGIDALDADIPMVLLPVRLETRFARGARGLELLVRIYPDQIHQDVHEPELAPQERTWGEHFWRQRWRAGGNAPREQQAFSQLAQRFGPSRAAWVARALRPTNPEARPTAPLDEDAVLDPAPAHPSPPARADVWTRAPRASLLPDRFLVLGYLAGQRVLAQWGNAIPVEVATGPSPAATAVDVAGLRIDEGMRWMVEFDQAERIGMGVRVGLDAQLADGLDRLLVLGVRAASTPADSGASLAALLSAHQYTDGLGLVAPGTPTNNGAVRSGYEARTAPASPSDWLADDPATRVPGPGTDGGALAAALGIDARSMLDVDGARDDHDGEAAAMLSALWPATGRYALEQLIDGTVGADERLRLREKVVAHVRARGPLPTLRVGRQPYGVLPTGSLTAWAGRGLPVDPRGLRVLRELRATWLAATATVPRAGASADPDRDLLGVLGMDALSASYAARPLLGPQYLENIHRFVFPTGVAPFPTAQTNANKVFDRFGLIDPANRRGRPRLSGGMYSPHAFPLRAPAVQRSGTSERKRLTEDYISWLRTHPCSQVLASRDSQGRPPIADDGSWPLLWHLLRHSVLLEIGAVAFTVLLDRGAVQPGDDRERELIDVVPGAPTTPTLRRHLTAPVQGRPLGDLLWPTPAAELAGLATPLVRLQDDLGRIATLPTATLERLMRETLDLFSHRLDAWVTALATGRLAEMRHAKPTGSHVAAFGWIEELRPRATIGPLPAATAEKPADSAGFIHAPSLPHATTAAVLRSGQRSHRTSSTGKLLGIDLSSRRVRAARQLLDGVRQGQRLGSLLGYRLERTLGQARSPRLSRYIPVLRGLAPAVAGKVTPSGDGLDEGAGTSVADGLALLRRHQGLGVALPWGTTLPALASPEGQALARALDDLEEAMDALSDALIAESVHQAVQGNPARAGGAIDAIDRGEAPVPELEFARTARSGVGVTHRVGVLRPAAQKNPSERERLWMVDPARPAPRARAEPVLNALAADLLPDPRRVRWRVRMDDPGGGQQLEEDVTLDLLGLCPLDVVYAATVGEVPGASELEQRALLATVESHNGRPTGLALVFERDADWPPSDLSVPELLETARAVREVLTDARALDARDLAAPGTLSGRGRIAQSLQDRATSLLETFKQAAKNLQSILEMPAATAADLRAALRAVADYGFPAALPGVWPAGEEPARLHTQARAVLVQAGERMYAGQDALAAATAAATSDDAVEHLVAAVQAVLGRAFRVLPSFTLESGLALDFSQQAAPAGADPDAVERWLGWMARVRSPLQRLQTVRLYAAAVAPTAAASAFRVDQRPRLGNDSWAALPGPNQGPPPAGQVSLVFDVPTTIDLAQPLAGLLIDDWVEVVPADHEITGVAFHYDAPGSEPPQAILLAVPPDARTHWSAEALEEVLLETLDLARFRTVDIDALGDVGHFIPALFVAFNAAEDTVSVDLKRVAPP